MEKELHEVAYHTEGDLRMPCPHRLRLEKAVLRQIEDYAREDTFNGAIDLLFPHSHECVKSVVAINYRVLIVLWMLDHDDRREFFAIRDPPTLATDYIVVDF